LQPIAEKYYDIVKKASDGLASKTPNFHSIISEMETQRSALIIARNGILGATAAFKYDSFGPPPEPPAEKIRNEFEELIYRFAESIWNYFYQESQLVRVPKSTRMINLIMSMHGAADVLEAPRIRREEKLNILTKVRQFAQNDLEKLENNWIIVSERYMHLKLYCNK
jgi:hypothetical protein